MGMFSGGGWVDPYLRRWMLFVDGENLTIRLQEFASEHGFELTAGPYYQRNTFVWIPDVPARDATVYSGATPRIQHSAVRAHYYTSVTGDEDLINDIRGRLWSLGFHPEVFKKARQDEKAKGVDIALTKDMLTHAFFNNYEVAVLIAGDGDYIPLVDEVKRLGKVVCLAFLSASGLNLNLQLKADMFAEIGSSFRVHWGAHNR